MNVLPFFLIFSSCGVKGRLSDECTILRKRSKYDKTVKTTRGLSQVCSSPGSAYPIAAAATATERWKGKESGRSGPGSHDRSANLSHAMTERQRFQSTPAQEMARLLDSQALQVESIQIQLCKLGV
jgi:hypothetical protein